MKLLDIANEYSALNIHNQDTHETIIRVARLFDKRSEAEDATKLSIDDLTRYKLQTLEFVNANTFNGYLGHLRVIGNYAVEAGYWKSNIFSRMKKAPVPKRAKRVVQWEAYQGAIEYLLSNPTNINPAWFWIIVIRFIYSTGVRRRQVPAINIEHVDFERWEVLLIAEGSKTLREWKVPLVENVMVDLRFLIEQSEMALGRELKGSDPLFNVGLFGKRYRTKHGRMSREQISRAFVRIAKGSGCKIGAHALRHTVATHLCNPVKEGVEPDLFTAQYLLGHTQLSTTLGYVETSTSRAKAYLNEGLREDFLPRLIMPSF